MPYASISELPPDVLDKYDSDVKRRAFMQAFNSAFESCDDDKAKCEQRAFAIAHAAAQRAGNKTIWQKVKEWFTTEAAPIPCGFKMIDDSRWVAWYTNSFGPDKDGEFISTKAIEADVSRMIATEQYPPLWFFHMKGSQHGKTDAVGLIGRFAVATGTFDDTPLAANFREFYKAHDEQIAMSFGFDYDPTKRHKGIYEQVTTFEISTVWPAKYASNPFTVFDVYGVENMQPQVEALKKVFADKPELLEDIIRQTERKTESLEQSTAYKALLEHLEKAEVEVETEETETETPEPEKPMPMQSGLTKEELAELLGAMQKSMVAEMKAMLGAMSSEVEKRKPDGIQKTPGNPHLLDMIRELATEQAQESKTVKAADLTPSQVIAMMNMGGIEAYEKALGVKVVK